MSIPSNEKAGETVLVCQRDLEHTFAIVTHSVWEHLRGKSIFITGGTGFIGKWLVATLLHADDCLKLNCRITLLSRDPDRFLRANPQYQARLKFVQGDVKSFEFPKAEVDLVIHGATDVSNPLGHLETFNACMEGTRRVLDFCKQANVKRLLLLSSGAVYGALSSTLSPVAESFSGAPDPTSPQSAYGEGKRVSEWLACAQQTENFEVTIARIFALVGPHLPLDKHFAIGNFILAARRQEAIIINGDGTPLRSYLYAADMAGWLWKILLLGGGGRAYNVGSDVAISILELAKKISSLKEANLKITVKQQYSGQGIQAYVPDITRIREELAVPPPISLEDSVLRTLDWLDEMSVPPPVVGDSC